ncbi:MAG: hypothetical protein U9N73_00015 [Candidatus Auribacterota bacterium]|nr:hypothetical protein [Candidatus Auribacterota bacterium]
MRKLLLIGLGCVLLFSSAVSAGEFKSGLEPTGFRGITWGTKIADLAGFKLKRMEDRFGGLDVYSREGEKAEVWGVPVAAILYFSWKGKFFRVSILVAGLKSYQNFRDVVFKRFGVGELQPAPAPGVTEFQWKGKITTMILRYEAAAESGSLIISSRKLEDRLLAESLER